MKRIIIVGRNFSTLTDYLEVHGYDYIVLKDRQHAQYPKKVLKHRLVCGFSSKKDILTAVDSINKPVHGVIATYENYILPAAWIAQHLGLPGLSPKTAEICTDKLLMRQCFARAPQKISPDFALVKDELTLREFAKFHSFPLILKPANLAKSLLVTKSNNLAELLANYKQTMQHIQATYQKYAPLRTPKLLVEEFLHGSIHSVDVFTGANGVPHVLDHIVDYQTGYDIGFDDNFHYSRMLPSRLSAQHQTALKQCAAVGVQTLGIKNAPSHVEVIMTPSGPRIVEIGARNGGYRERMHRLANGLDITGAALALSLGTAPNLVATKNESCAVLELFPQTPGIFTAIDHKEELETLPSFYSFSVKMKPGTFVGKAANGFKMCATVLLHNTDTAQFKRDVDFINKHVRVKTETAHHAGKLERS